MPRKLLISLVATFLLLDVISSNNNNVYAANTKAGTVEDLFSDSAYDKDNEALKVALDEQTSESEGVSDNAASKAIDEKKDEAEEYENNERKETDKESSAKSEEEDAVLDDVEDNEDTDDLQEKRRQKRLQNRRNRIRRRNNLRNRRIQQENAKTDYQALSLSENSSNEAVDYVVDPSTDNIVYIQPATEVTKQETNSELPKDINIISRRPKINTRSISPRGKTQKKRAAGAKTRQRRGNARNRRTAAKKSNARKAKARPARRQPARSARRSTKKFMLNGIKFPKSNQSRAANRNRQQRPRARAGRRSNA